MARKRLIDTHSLCFDTEIVTILKERGSILYIRLWGIAEDWGGYDPKYDDIALLMGAFKLKASEVKNYIDRLIEAKKIIPYEVNGKTYHWIVNLLKHQPLDNPSAPKLPLPEWVECKISEYKSGKKYAKYTVITEKLPVAYSSPTGNLVTVTETVTVTERKQNSNSNGNRIETTREGKQEITHPPYVFLSLEEQKSLMADYGKQKTNEYIDRLNEHIGSKGTKYKSHYFTIKSWMRKDGVRKPSYMGTPSVRVPEPEPCPPEVAAESIQKMRELVGSTAKAKAVTV